MIARRIFAAIISALVMARPALGQLPITHRIPAALAMEAAEAARGPGSTEFAIKFADAKTGVQGIVP